MNGNSMYEKQRGQVSMVTVTVFMLIFTVMVVGFAYLAMNSMRQSTNDSLSASASNAAESGVEDAKRMLRWCYQHYLGNGTYDNSHNSDWNATTDTPFCQTVIGKVEGLSNINCTDTIKTLSNTTKKYNFQIESDGNGGQRIKVGGSGSDDEYYQCLKIYTLSRSFVGKLEGDGKSVVVPLRLVDRYGNNAIAKNIKISWHKLSPAAGGGDGSVTNIGKLGSSSTSLPKKTDWTGAGNLPALMRVQTVRGQKGKVNVATMVNDSATAYFRPVSAGGVGTADLATFRPRVQMNNYGNSAYTYNNSTSAVNNAGSNPVVAAKCNNTAVVFACSQTITFGAGDFNTQQYEWYLRLTAMYKDTHFEITATDAAGNTLYFDGTQPVVDVTGKSADSYSRVEAHIEPSNNEVNSANNWWPEYTIDTNGNICKQIDVKYNNGIPQC